MHLTLFSRLAWLCHVSGFCLIAWGVMKFGCKRQDPDQAVGRVCAGVLSVVRSNIAQEKPYTGLTEIKTGEVRGSNEINNQD